MFLRFSRYDHETTKSLYYPKDMAELPADPDTPHAHANKLRTVPPHHTRTHSRRNTALMRVLHTAELVAHQSRGATSAIVTYAVRISGSACGCVAVPSSLAVYRTTMRGNCTRSAVTSARKRMRTPARSPVA